MADEQPFGPRVRERRRALDLTQEELARRVGCAGVTLRKIEGGHLRASRQIAERLAAAFGLPLEEREAFVRAARSAIVERGENRETTPSRSPLLLPAEVGGDDLSGRAIRSYLLGERIGMGGFGAVYRAVQPGVEREVAIKLILPRFADHPDFIRRFETEARLVARLEHPHIVPLYDYWRDPGFAFLVMRFLRGGALARLLQSGPLTLGRVLQIVEQIGAALAVAHRAGVVHRDLKPANILLDEDGNVFLADFGIARDLASAVAEQSGSAYIGSPAYSAPEQIRDEPVVPQTDIYAFGVLIFELLSGKQPFRGPSPAAIIGQQLNSPLPRLAGLRPGLDDKLDRVLQRATAKLPGERHPSVAALIAELRAALVERDAVAVAPASWTLPAAMPTILLDLEEGDNPYKGLQSFAEADASSFFGRETLVHRLLSRLGERGDLVRFLAVVGPSGSGKSSVVRAGLIPALRRGGLPGSESWYIVDLVPGSDPLAELTRALLRIAPGGVEADDLMPLLRADQRGLLRAARRVLPPDDGSELVLLIDQFEELFTLTSDEAARTHLLECIVVAAIEEQSRVRVIVTLRADFVDRPLQYADFGELLRQRSELVLPLTPEELELSILGPARQVGLVLEDGLVSTLVGATAGQPGALPLLQHTLGELFARRRGRLLTLRAYHELGGVSGALARSAETIYAQLSDAGQQAARQLLLRLVSPGAGAEDTRRRARRRELGLPEAGEIIHTFASARLLTLDHDPFSREPTVEVAHEALLHGWPRLRAWLDESREALRQHRQLARAAEEWASAGEEASYLASGARLEQFTTLAQERLVALSDAEWAYLTVSQAAEAQARAEAERRRRERDAQRLSAEAALAVERGDPVLGALLALHVLDQGYSAQADGALLRSMGYFLHWRTLPGAGTNMGRLAIAPDGSYLIIGKVQGVYGGALIYDHRLGQVTRALDAHLTWVDDLCLAPRSAQLALSGDGIVSIWELSSGEQLHELRHPAPVRGLCYLDDTRLLTACNDGSLRVFASASGELLCTHHLGTALSRVALTPDQRLLAIGTVRGSVILWDLANERVHTELVGHVDEVFDVVFSPDGSLLASAGQDQTARVWNVASGDTLRVLSGHGERVQAVAFSPDGALLATGSLDGQARLWHAASGYPLQVGLCPALGAVGFAPGGDELMAIGLHESRSWRLAPLREPRLLLGHSRIVHQLAFARDGSWLISAGDDATARVWNCRDGRELRRILHPGPVESIAVTPDETRLLSTCEDGVVRCWERESGTLLWAEAAPGPPLEINVSPDGERFLLRSWQGTVELRAIADGAVQRQLEGIQNIPWEGIFNSSGQIVGVADRPIHRWHFWDARTGAPLAQLGGPDDPIHAACFLGEDRLLLAGEQGARIVDLDGAGIPVWLSHAPFALAFAAADGRRAILISAQGQSAQLWELDPIQFIREHNLPPFTTVSASSDCLILAVGEYNGAIRLYHSEPQELMALARAQLQRTLTAEERGRFGIAEP